MFAEELTLTAIKFKKLTLDALFLFLSTFKAAVNLCFVTNCVNLCHLLVMKHILRSSCIFAKSLISLLRACICEYAASCFC